MGAQKWVGSIKQRYGNVKIIKTKHKVDILSTRTIEHIICTTIPYTWVPATVIQSITFDNRLGSRLDLRGFSWTLWTHITSLTFCLDEYVYFCRRDEI